MSNMRNIHRIMGACFTHFKPNLCPTCTHRQPYTDGEGNHWNGYCAAKRTVLCCEKSQKARCQDYAAKGE